MLLVGSGGREHALAWKLGQSDLCAQVYCTPGNPGIAREAKVQLAPGLDPSDHAAVARFCAQKEIGLVLVGPEAPLVAGLADALQEAGVPTFGPSAAAAQLEGSKAFMKVRVTQRRDKRERRDREGRWNGGKTAHWRGSRRAQQRLCFLGHLAAPGWLAALARAGACGGLTPQASMAAAATKRDGCAAAALCTFPPAHGSGAAPLQSPPQHPAAIHDHHHHL